MEIVFLRKNVVSQTNIQWFNDKIHDDSQTCVSCMLPGAGRTEPQLGRVLLLESTGTSVASCSALRGATSLSKYACHKTHHRNYSLHAERMKTHMNASPCDRPVKTRLMWTINHLEIWGTCISSDQAGGCTSPWTDTGPDLCPLRASLSVSRHQTRFFNMRQ